MEGLEDRRVLATFAIADFFPLSNSLGGAAEWTYAGTVVDGSDAHDVTGTMVATGGQSQSGQTFTELLLSLTGTGYTASIGRYYAHTGLGLVMGRDQWGRGDLKQTNSFGSGFRVVDPGVDIGTPGTAYAYGRSYSGTDSDGGSWSSLSPHATGATYTNGQQTLDTPIGMLEAHRLKREGSYKDSGTDGELQVFIRNGTVTEELWLVDGIGIARWDLTVSETGRPDGDVTWSVSVTITDTTLPIGAPVIQVRGSNSTVIAHDDATPSLVDGTAFGSADVNGQTVVRMFTIFNTGTGLLRLAPSPGSGPSITMSGLAPDQYSVSLPGGTRIAPGQSLSFTVTFDPSSVGNRRARVNVYTDSTVNAAFGFSVLGVGVANGLIELRSGPANGVISNGATVTSRDNGTRFGVIAANGGTFTRIYKLTNVGVGSLVLTGSPLVSLGGRNAGQFAITGLPTTPIGPGETVKFRVTFTPKSAGFKRATVSFGSSDWRFGTFSFDITGTAT